MKKVRCLLASLICMAGCQLFSGGGKAKTSGSKARAECPAPTDPMLLGIAPQVRSDVLGAAKAGLVVVRYEVDGCDVLLDVKTDCRLLSQYEYAAEHERRTEVIKDREALRTTLPLHSDGLVRALDKYGALRVDEEVVGQLRAPPSAPRHRGALSGSGCAGVSHVAVAIDLGGASLVAGKNKAIKGRNYFLKPSRSRDNPAPLQYVGRVKTCRTAKKRGAKTPGCDHPLRLELLPLAAAPEKRDPPPMIELAAGKFVMGRAGQKSGDGPKHSVYLDAFSIDRIEVSAADYAACVAQKACTPAGQGRFCTASNTNKEDHPINRVTWKQAAAYCKSVDKRLPTEAEWERAARGTDGRRFVWGKDWPPPARSGNFADQNAQQREPEWRSIDGYRDGHAYTAPVAKFTAESASGALALAGNVQEWVADWYDPRAYSAKKRKNPTGPSRGKARVVRGASFGHALAGDLEVTRRAFYAEDRASAHIGFRCAK